MNGDRFSKWSDTALTLGLLAFAGLFIWVALMPGHHLIKAAVLAWAIF